jgi:aspartate 1-decarboxylase
VFANTTTTTYAERMRIDSSGNVIVGGTAPVYGASGRGVITINGSSTALLGFTAGGTDKGFLFHDGTNMLLSNTVSAAMLFQTANTERMRIDASGNVGIGTSSFLFGSAGRGVLELNGSASSLLALKRNDNNSAYIFANSAALEIVNVEATPTTFFTNATERMRIASDGRVLIGTSTNFNASFVSVVAGSNRGMGISSSASTAHVLQVDNNNTAYADSGGGMLYIQGAGTTETAYRAISVYGAGARFAVRGDGTIYSTNTSVQSISDVRFKENIKDIDTGLEEILKIQPRRFDWKEGKGTGEKNVAGFIAQEIETVFPELVSEFKDQLDDETMYKSVGYAGLIPSLVKAIQEQQTLINNLTTRLNALEGK